MTSIYMESSELFLMINNHDQQKQIRQLSTMYHDGKTTKILVSQHFDCSEYTESEEMIRENIEDIN